MGLHSLRILAQAGFSGVFFAAKILRGELPRYRLPLPEFAANVIPCSAPLTKQEFENARCRRAGEKWPRTPCEHPQMSSVLLGN